jgi:DNA polymerase-3 subunit gamma/tau
VVRGAAGSPATGSAVSAAGQVADEPSLDDDDAPAHPGAALTGEEAAMALLRTGLGATVIQDGSPAAP